MMRSAIRSLLAEPRAAEPPERVWRDWALVAVLVPTSLLEGLLRDAVVWRGVALALALALVPLLLWRRTRPLLVVSLAFGSLTLVGIAGVVAGVGASVGLYATACVLLLPYSLLRWGSGREIAIGLAFILAALVIGIAGDYTGAGDAIGGSLVLLFPAALGAAIRYREGSRLREIDQVKLREREQLARELHDTVAHYVSAIAIQAQAGRTVAAADPAEAVRALEQIEEAASRSLEEMRTMIATLREGEEADLAPQPGIADLERLAAAGPGPRVEVACDHGMERLRPSVSAAIYRVAQESVTNARRHACNASQIEVRLSGDAGSVRLTVRDDGDRVSGARNPDGFGLIGMAERAMLLGGTVDAGPGRDGGWLVEALLPRENA